MIAFIRKIARTGLLIFLGTTVAGCAAGDQNSAAGGSTTTTSPAGAGGAGGAPGVCGDAICNATESQSICCQDCGCPDGSLCQSGTCGCPEGLSSCSESCVDVGSDHDNCGSCGNACQASQVCAEGQCKADCSGLVNCGGSCVDPSSNILNCGACGQVCDANKTCSNGQCVCKPTSPPDEVCDNMDNDCDGFVDEGDVCCIDVLEKDVLLFPLTQIAGGSDFEGNGPDVVVEVSVAQTPDSVTVTSCVTMTETTGDSIGSLCHSQVTLVANAGLVGDNFFEVKYRDTDTAEDDPKSEAAANDLDDSPSLVKAVTCQGNTESTDICSGSLAKCSHCKLTLGCVNVKGLPPQ